MTVFVQTSHVEALLKAYDKGPTDSATVAALQTMIKGATVDYNETNGNTISVFLKDLKPSIIAPPPPSRRSSSPSRGSSPSAKDDVALIEGYCPLTNLGNSCYMNALIQMLYSIQELRDFFQTLGLKSIRKDNIHNIGPLIDSTGTLTNTFVDRITPDEQDRIIRIITALRALFQTLHKKKGRVVNIETDVKIDTTNVYSIFLSLIRNTGIKGAQNDPGDILANIIESFEYFTPIKSIYRQFNLTMTQIYRCENSDNTITQIPSTNFDTLIPFVLPLEKNIATTIQTLINDYISSNGINDRSENIECNGPNRSGYNLGSIQTLHTVNETKYILIQLKRFFTDQDPIRKVQTGSSKLNNKITPDPIIIIDSKRFQLKGCICHGGALNGGHYWYILCNNGIPYLELNDANPVRKVPSNYDLTVNGYFYLYERANTPAAVGGARTTRKHARSRVHAPTRKSSRSSPQTWEADKGESQTELL
jgi:ubiquitin C-terminal hydrolase